MANPRLSKKVPTISKYRKEFVLSHLKRIFVAHRYAISQNNNHWLSEAAAIFIGGAWISEDKYVVFGINSLENCINSLVMEDGSFSQYSNNYHRLVVDTLCQVELWRRILNLPKFSSKYYKKCKKAIQWLNDFVDPVSGKSSNLGANEAYCYQLHSPVLKL